MGQRMGNGVTLERAKRSRREHTGRIVATSILNNSDAVRPTSTVAYGLNPSHNFRISVASHVICCPSFGLC
jgi:hypothetical protein